MKFLNCAAILLLVSGAEATKVKSQAQMLSEIEAMSMSSNMHQVSLREKSLLKTYLQVDLNEFFQQKVDSDVFEGLDEKQKAEFVGNFFHWVKCRFQDCNLVQTKAKLNMKQASQQPTIEESTKWNNKVELEGWGRQGNMVRAWNDKPRHGAEVAYAQTSEANASANKQTVKAKVAASTKKGTHSPTAAESKVREDKADLDAWGKQGNLTSAFHTTDKSYVQTTAVIATSAKSESEADRKARLVSDQFP